MFVRFKFMEHTASSPVLLLKEEKEKRRKQKRKKRKRKKILTASSPIFLLNEGREKRRKEKREKKRKKKKKEKTHRVFPRPPLEGGKRRDALVVLVLDLDVEFKIQILI